MDSFIEQLHANRKPNQKKRKRERPEFLPYDPRLSLPCPERCTIPETWIIKPGKLTQFADAPQHQSQEIHRLLEHGSMTDISQGSSSEEEHRQNVMHLFARAAFGLSVAEAETLAASSLDDLTAALLTKPSPPEPPGDWVDEPFDIVAFRDMTPEEQMAFFMENFRRIETLRGWWLELMLASPFNLWERMTLFWHGHFTTDIESAVLAQFLYKQNATLRQFALGSFGDFLKAIYKDPAMLLYLDGYVNHAQAPNENFARELLELFTMGVGHYTEQDIKEAARAFTGWQIDTINLTGFFNPLLHDYGSKTFLGQTGNFDGDDIIDIILQQPQTARFICTKLYASLVSREIDNGFVDDLATIFRDGNYEIKPVLQAIFDSDHFYDEYVRAAIIKSPVDLSVSNARMLSSQEVNVRFMLVVQALLDQEIMNPPNVAGWPGQRAWVSPTTYVLRNTFSEFFINPELLRDPDTGETPIEFDVMAFARSFHLEQARELARAMVNHLLRMPIPDETFEFLLSVMLGTASEDDWSLNYPGAETLIARFLIQIVRLPEFHLS